MWALQFDGNSSGGLVLVVGLALSAGLILALNLWYARLHTPGKTAPKGSPVAGEKPLSSSGAAKDPRERRRSRRRFGNPVKVMVQEPMALAAPLEGVVIDRSTGGLCLSLAEPKTQGVMLQVRAQNAPEAFPWVSVEVRHCRQKDGRWLLGCKFQKRYLMSEIVCFG